MGKSKEILIKYIIDFLKDPAIKKQKLLNRTNKKSIIEVCFDHIIRWTPQISEDGRDSYGIDVLERIKTHRISNRLFKEIISEINSTDFSAVSNKNELNSCFNELKKRINKKIHYEHNPPVEVIKQKLMKIYSEKEDELNEEEIHKILTLKYEVILISQEEHKALDSKAELNLDGKQFKGKGLKKSGEFDERLKSINATLIDNNLKNTIFEDFQRIKQVTLNTLIKEKTKDGRNNIALET